MRKHCNWFFSLWDELKKIVLYIIKNSNCSFGLKNWFLVKTIHKNLYSIHCWRETSKTFQMSYHSTSFSYSPAWGSYPYIPKDVPKKNLIHAFRKIFTITMVGIKNIWGCSSEMKNHVLFYDWHVNFANFMWYVFCMNKRFEITKMLAQNHLESFHSILFSC